MSIIEEINALLVQHRLQKIALNHYQQMASPLYVLEARHTLFHVNRLLQNQPNPSLARTLETFLKNRWERLKNTDAQYFHDTHNPANQMCIEVAKSLARLQNKPYLSFLIPILATVPASEYVASSYKDDDLDFKQLILSDDGTRMIHIPEALEFAEQDGVLKHSSLFNGCERALSIAEQSRLLARHPSVENYYHAVRDKVNFQLHGETAGAYIARLIMGLREGGSQGSGAELLTGDEANVAIADFSIFLEGLTNQKRRKIFNAGKFERWTTGALEHATIGQSWRLLINPSQLEEDGEQTITYCVELIADKLEEILKENATMLYRIMPFEQEGVGTIISFEDAVNQCKTAMLSHLNTSKAHRYYGAIADDRLAFDVFSKLSRDKTFHLAIPDIAYVARCYAGHHPALRKGCDIILLDARGYISPTRMRCMLKRLPETVAHAVRSLIYPRLNTHLFFSATSTSVLPEEEVALEGLKKKVKYDHVGVCP